MGGPPVAEKIRGVFAVQIMKVDNDGTRLADGNGDGRYQMETQGRHLTIRRKCCHRHDKQQVGLTRSGAWPVEAMEVARRAWPLSGRGTAVTRSITEPLATEGMLLKGHNTDNQGWVIERLWPLGPIEPNNPLFGIITEQVLRARAQTLKQKAPPGHPHSAPGIGAGRCSAKDQRPISLSNYTLKNAITGTSRTASL